MMERWTQEDIESLMDWAVRLGVNLSKNSLEGCSRYTEIATGRILGHVNHEDCDALLGVCQREQDKWAGRPPPPIVAFRPQPGEQDVGNWPIKLPATVMDAQVQLSAAASHFIRGGVADGAMGVGKTTLGSQCASALMDKGVPYVITDPHKDHAMDYLQQRHPLLILEPGKDFWLNPYEGCLQDALDADAAIMETHDRKDARIISADTIHAFFRDNPGAVLTFRKSTELLSRSKPPLGLKHKANLLLSLATVIMDIESSPLSETFNCIHGHDFGAQLKQGISLLLRTSNLTDLQEFCLICLIFKKIFSALARHPDIASYDGIKVGVLLDESTRFVSEKIDANALFLGPLTTCILDSRSEHCATFLLAHNFSAISKALRSSIHVQFHGAQSSEADMKAIKDTCTLNDAQKNSLAHLGVGEFCCKWGSGYMVPFLVKVDPAERTHLSEDEIQARNRQLLAELPPIVREEHRPAAVASMPPSVANTPSTIPAITPNRVKLIRALLQHIHDNMFLGVRDRFNVFKFNGKRIPMKTGDELLAEMEASGLCVCIPIRLSLKGAATKFFALTDAGYEFIGSPDNRLIPSGGSSIQHLFRLELLARKILKAQGIHAVIEAEKNGKKCDVSCQHKDLSIGIEVSVETPVDHEMRQAITDISAGWDRVITVFDSHDRCLKAEQCFITEHGTALSDKITFAEFWHLATFPIETIYNSAEVLFKPK